MLVCLTCEKILTTVSLIPDEHPRETHEVWFIPEKNIIAVVRDLTKGRTPPLWVQHSVDGDCSVDPVTDTCRGCGVHHGNPCPECTGRAFHRPGCSRYVLAIPDVPGPIIAA